MLALLGVQTTEEEIRSQELEQLLLQVGRGDREAFARGVTLADGSRCRSAGLTLLGGGREVLVTLHEGKFHQIKRMAASRGAAVCYLKRLSMGPLELDGNLNKGEYRLLTREEVAKIGGKG